MLVLVSVQTPLSAQTAPDAPRSAQVERKAVKPTMDQAQQSEGPVELKSVSIRGVRPQYRNLAGDHFLKDASAPLAIEVVTERPFPAQPRTSSPVIVLNGERLLDTWVLLPDKMVAFLPDRTRLKETNSVVVEWIGNEERTRSRRALSFRSADIVDSEQ